MSRSTRRLIPVLGMHRSGTSIATRGLACLGVSLGDDLLAGSAGDNPTGYFEDAAIHAICEHVLDAVGSSWHDLAPIETGPLDSARVRGLANDAVALLERRLEAQPIFAFKNPRTSKLHAFFEPVFARLDADVRSVFVTRHPLSVIRSLEARDGFDPAKSAQLWLAHSLEAVLGVGTTPATCIDYDELITSPRDVLTRVARELDLDPPREAELDTYVTSLLDEGLRHTTFDAEDLGADPRVNTLVGEAWQLLRSCARGDASLADESVRRALAALRTRATLLAPLSELASRQERAVDRLSEENTTLREQIELQQRMIEDREDLIAVRDEAVRDQRSEIERQHDHIESLKNEIVDLRYEAGTQRAAFSEAGNRIESLWNVGQQLRADHARTEEQLHARLAEALARVETLRDERLTLEARVEGLEAAADRERAEELDAARNEVGHLHGLLMRARADLERVQAHSAEAQRRADELQVELDAERRGSIEWFHTQAAQIAGRLVDAAQALRETRAWRVSRRIQTSVDRRRLARPIDAAEHLQNLMIELQARARRHDMDALALLDFTRLVDETKRHILDGRIFKVLRRANAIASGPRRRGAAPGPVEQLEHGIAELLEFAAQMAQAPFTTAEPTLEPGEALLGSAKDARVDVVIPVYGGREATLDCIASVGRSRNRTPIELVVIDDATPDVDLARELDRLDQAGEITLLRNERNLGFPATANRGMALHPERDVVLLNADTRVNGDWLDRMRAAAHSDWNVATVTPFSNNAEICSYPRVCQVNEYPGVSEQARIDGAMARVNAGRTLTIPTAVGFCMYLRRDALRQVGPFDALRFERGYGEENDLCMRLRARGLRNVLAADVYVAHAGGASFGDEKQALVDRALARLAEVYPDYEREVGAFIADDPMKSLRVRAEAALLPRAGDATVLFVTHDRGGGTARHVDDLAGRLEREGVRVLMLSPEPSGAVRLELWDEDRPSDEIDVFSNLRFDVETDFDDLLASLRTAGVAHVHFHHLIGLPDGIARLPQRLGITYDVTAHDYFAACPRTHMIGASGVYCGEPEDVDECSHCIARIGSPVGRAIDVGRWRERSQSLLEGARRVFVPSDDAAARLGRYFDDVRWLVRPHAEPAWTANSVVAPKRGGETRVAVVGAIGYHKGSRILAECARDAADRKLPLHFVLIGHTDRTEELRGTRHVEVTGPYEESNLMTLLERARCQLAFLPSVWPETYCFTLSHVVRAQLHPVVFDLGAPAARVRAMGFGDVLPLGWTATQINDRLLAIEPADFPRDRVEAAHDHPWTSCLKDYYDGLVLEAPEHTTPS